MELLAAVDQARRRRRTVRELVARHALPLEVVVAGGELDTELQAAVDRLPVQRVLRWLPRVSGTRARRLLEDAGLDPAAEVRLGDLPPGVRARLAGEVARRADRRRAKAG